MATMDRNSGNLNTSIVLETFESWLLVEREQGLEDIKFALNPSIRNNPSVEKVMGELIQCEEDVRAGKIEEPLYDNF